MSDTSPKNQGALVHNAPKAPPRQPKPGEILFEFYRERDHTRWLCELRDHGEYGVEAQFYRNEELNRARRFDRSMNLARAPRDMAIGWAEQERLHIEGD